MKVAICVPVRDEALLLPRLLASLGGQDMLSDLHIDLCFAFDACTDGSERIVAAATLPYAVHAVALPKTETPNAGRARRAAMALGERTKADMLLTTDADSVPAPNWVAANLRALAVADVVTGRIVRDGLEDTAQDRLERYYDALYALRRRFDPVPWEAHATHHYTAGASLAFHTAAYTALGGFEARPSAEDARIVDAAHRAGLRVRRDAAVRVETSSRRVGRAVNGLADHLRTLEGGDAIRVGDPDRAAWHYAGHAAARRAYGANDAAYVQLAATIARGVEDVRRDAADSPNAEAFAMRVVPGHPAGERLVTLDEAEAALDALAFEQAA